MPPAFPSSVTFAASASFGAIAVDGATLNGVGNGFVIVGSPGVISSQRRRIVATSPWVAGGVEVASVKDEQRWGGTFRCWGTDVGHSEALAYALARRIERTAHTITEVLGTTTLTYQCRAGDWSLDKSPANLRLGCVEITVDVPAVLSGSNL